MGTNSSRIQYASHENFTEDRDSIMKYVQSKDLFFWPNV